MNSTNAGAVTTSASTGSSAMAVADRGRPSIADSSPTRSPGSLIARRISRPERVCTDTLTRPSRTAMTWSPGSPSRKSRWRARYRRGRPAASSVRHSSPVRNPCGRPVPVTGQVYERPSPYNLAMPATADDVAELTALLGRPPQAEFEVVVRTSAGRPAVIRNAPLLDDGTPMPTRYWLRDPALVLAVSRLEGDGGGGAPAAAPHAQGLAPLHTPYAAERGAAPPSAHHGPRPRRGGGAA